MLFCRFACRNTISPAFTLVELLVVVAIISILAALLLPTLLSAQLSARDTTCVSNGRQQAIASLLYADDSADYFPVNFNDFTERYHAIYLLLNSRYIDWQIRKVKAGSSILELWATDVLTCPRALNEVDSSSPIPPTKPLIFRDGVYDGFYLTGSNNRLAGGLAPARIMTHYNVNGARSGFAGIFTTSYDIAHPFPIVSKTPIFPCLRSFPRSGITNAKVCLTADGYMPDSGIGDAVWCHGNINSDSLMVSRIDGSSKIIHSSEVNSIERYSRRQICDRDLVGIK